MTIAVAHQLSAYSDAVLLAAGREAAAHGEQLVVFHVVTTSDLDTEEALQTGIDDIVAAALKGSDAAGVSWSVEVVAGTSTAIDDVAQAILAATARSGARLLVIGARRRSPVGKAFLGSITQQLILDADVPVLVVKAGTTSP